MTSVGAELLLPSGVRLRNRLVKAAMSEQLADRHHQPTRELVDLYRRWASSGAGTLITGNMMVDRDGVSEPRQVVLDASTSQQRLRAWAEAGREQGAELWAQLNHAGGQVPRLVRGSVRGPGSSPPSKTRLLARVHPFTSREIEALVTKFADAAEIAMSCGFTGVQVHAAHGYLISQFLSPVTNPRTDAWGGDEGRRRAFLQAVLRSVRRRIGPSATLAVKLNSSDFIRGGISKSEALATLRAAAGEGVDLIEISGGTFASAAMIGRAEFSPVALPVASSEAYFGEFLLAARAVTTAPLMLTGGFRTRAGMEEALQNGADLIGLGRPMVLVPHVPTDLLHGASVELDRPRNQAGRAGLLPAGKEIAWYTERLRLLAADPTNHTHRKSAPMWALTRLTARQVMTTVSQRLAGIPGSG